ncbi:MAG: YggT family protein [Candidatus Peregrinibacteria bacterium]|nr:YggT family protein [Candidatus Peregrinibacteria bacterium]
MQEKVEIQEASPQPANYEIAIHDHRVYRMVHYALGIAEVLLVFRFFLLLLGANPASGFARVVYTLSAVLMFPFSGLFNVARIEDATTAENTIQSVFDPTIVVALIVYAVIAWFAARLILIIRSTPTKD